jgi:hypothetical protein
MWVSEESTERKAYDTKLKKKAEKLDWSCVTVATI